ncbi:MAG: uncharacterized protein QOK43_185 [Acidimicrobiaceae bacterium]|nr:uncharacterized protein [Acidimicrobiaceae bacterium]
MSPAFQDVITTEAELRTLYREPGAGAVRKEIDRLDDNARALIAHSPFVLIATAAADGRCDVSPKGGPPGFVRVLDDHRLAIPDMAGNNRLDSMQNLVANPGIALLFVIPGLDETFRVNGQARITRDADVLDQCEVAGLRPRVVIGVEVETAYIHCAKALRRGSVWQPDAWPDRTDMPSVACMLRDHVGDMDVPVEAVQARLDQSYATTMWRVD